MTKPSLAPDAVRKARRLYQAARASGRRVKWKAIARQVGGTPCAVREAGIGRTYRGIQ